MTNLIIVEGAEKKYLRKDIVMSVVERHVGLKSLLVKKIGL